MKILSMTATFGKLEHQTLTFQPGLNVIHAPNEWGKSTWCAFLTAMLYGIETRERTTAKVLADKERYAPWSGSPMSGRIDLNWNGKNITIQRRTKGRTIFGEFSAFETDTGIPLPELTAANCGQVLLGVEKSVFLRSGFLRLADLPVTEDESLRRRLNALVTTGDESGASDALAQKLRDLKNKVRHNKTGALPQALAQKELLTRKLEELSATQEQIQRTQQEQQDLEDSHKALSNHLAALDYMDAQQDRQRIAAAEAAREAAESRLAQLQAQCDSLPDKDSLALQQAQLQQLQQDWAQHQTVPLPQPPQVPSFFTGMTGTQALEQATRDKAAYQALLKPAAPLLYILAAIFVVIGIGLAFWAWQAAVPCGIVAVILAIFAFRRAADMEAISARYGADPDTWVAAAENYVREEAAYQAALETYEAEKTQLQQKTAELCGDLTVAQVLAQAEQQRSQLQQLATARQEAEHARRYAADLAALAKDVPAPSEPDCLTLSRQETLIRLQEAAARQPQLQLRLGQLQGQAQTLGSAQGLTQQLHTLQQRITRLEDMYSALEIAQQTLSKAADELQRRFAPKISAQAQDIFHRLTGGRYDRLTLSQDLSLNAGAEGEDTLRTAQWRSDGTVDQLYLALRLAVARELTPQAPLILDDALVRFDDQRLAAALDILKEESQTRQVILFSCQGREQALMEK